jgi:hypothetical protein
MACSYDHSSRASAEAQFAGWRGEADRYRGTCKDLSTLAKYEERNFRYSNKLPKALS